MIATLSEVYEDPNKFHGNQHTDRSDATLTHDQQEERNDVLTKTAKDTGGGRPIGSQNISAKVAHINSESGKHDERDSTGKFTVKDTMSSTEDAKVASLRDDDVLTKTA